MNTHIKTYYGPVPCEIIGTRMDRYIGDCVTVRVTETVGAYPASRYTGYVAYPKGRILDLHVSTVVSV